jgi:hypothetical protein
VLIAGPGGLRSGPNLPVDVFICENRATCLASPGLPLGTVRTDANGRFTLRIPIEVLQRRVLLVSQVFVGGVRCRALFTARALSASAGALARGVARGAQEPELSIDPITEASVRLLEAAGLQGYSDEGIDAVIAAVQAANADTDFAGLDGNEANDKAEAVAANDPNVEKALRENRACVGDCDANGAVAVNELVLGVNVAIGTGASDDCPAFDPDQSGTVLVNELIQGVNNALLGCASPSPPPPPRTGA